MENSKSSISTIELGWAAIAWTQFLTIVTVVPRAEFGKIANIGTNFAFFYPGSDVTTISSLTADTTPFAGLSLLLNAVALGFLAMPLTRIREDAEAMFQQTFYYYRNIFNSVGALCWIFSLISFLLYLSPLIALLTTSVAMVSLFWIIILYNIKIKKNA